MATYPIYVDSSAAFGGNGSKENPFNAPSQIPWGNIQGAIGSGDKAKVLLARGSVFTEAMTVDASGTPDRTLDIQAYGNGDKPVFEGSGVVHALITCAKGWVNYYDLEVKNPLDDGIISQYGVYRMYDCDFIDSGDQNVQCENNATVYLTRCKIQNGVDDGISIHGGCVVYVDECYFEGNGQGINGIAGTTVHVEDSLFAHNSNNDILMGTVSGEQNTVKGCVIYPSGSTSIALNDGVMSNSIIDGRGLPANVLIASDNTTNAKTVNHCTILGNNANGQLAMNANTTMNVNSCIFYDLVRVAYHFSGTTINIQNSCWYSVTLEDVDSEVNRVDGDPVFYDSSIGISDFNPSTQTVAEFLALVKEGFRVKNTDLENAGHDGVTIGAADFFVVLEPDVVDFAVSSTPVRNGVVTTCNKFGSYNGRTVGTVPPQPRFIASRYTDRFDNPTYYPE
jgi:hypothetical protein